MTKYIKKADRAAYGAARLERGADPRLGLPQMLENHPEIHKWINAARRALIKDICPQGAEHLSAARQILLDRCLRKVSVALLIEATLTEAKVEAARPVVNLWLQIQRQIRDDLKVLGLERIPIDAGILTPDRLLDAVRKDVAEAEVCATASTSGPSDDPESGSSVDDSTAGGDE